MSSTGMPPSKFSVNYISRNNGDDDDGDDDNDKDAVIQLGNFNGSLTSTTAASQTKYASKTSKTAASQTT